MKITYATLMNLKSQSLKKKYGKNYIFSKLKNNGQVLLTREYSAI